MIKNEQDHTCEFCYYELFDDRAYPCNRCVCNQPTENMWRAKDKLKQGKWIGDKCSVCGSKRAWYGNNPPYCPDCGSRMKGADDEA
jgi:hypothetical protein